MATIVPRWEWRTFGTHFGIAETRFAELTPGAVQESDELYFLGGSGANVKMRDDLMDIKVLREVSAEGLERWEPVMKQPFPLPAADAAKVFASLGLAAPPLARDAYTLDQFVDELVAPSGALASRQGPQAPGPLHRRRLHLGGQRRQGGGEGHAHDRDRIGGRGRRHLGRRIGRPRRILQHELSAGPAGAAGRRAGAVRGDRRGHEFGQAPRRRA